MQLLPPTPFQQVIPWQKTRKVNVVKPSVAPTKKQKVNISAALTTIKLKAKANVVRVNVAKTNAVKASVVAIKKLKVKASAVKVNVAKANAALKRKPNNG